MTSGRSRADVAALAGFVVIVAFAVALHWPGVHTGLSLCRPVVPYTTTSCRITR